MLTKNSIYFGRLCHPQELHGSPEDGIVCRNILYIKMYACMYIVICYIIYNLIHKRILVIALDRVCSNKIYEKEVH
jgi:hypothetical protein